MISGKTFSPAEMLRAKHTALPAEHGAWVFLFSPLTIGLALGGVNPASLLLVASALAAFLIRQPVTMLVKVISGRRPKSERPAAVFWLAVYGLIGLASAAALAVFGYAFILWLALPALPVLAWHLWLVSRRAERRQAMVEIAASGVLALAAPAAYWVGRGENDPTGWLLWGLSWLQITGTILYAYLRLEQRVLKVVPLTGESFLQSRPALAVNIGAFVLVVMLAVVKLVPAWLPLAYLIQPLETLWGALRPAVGVKPTHIGVRQLIISSLFTLAFILLWQV